MAGISLEKIESLAPDQASLVAARKLVKPAGWSGLSSDSAGLIWGECQGAGSSPYRVIVSEAAYDPVARHRLLECITRGTHETTHREAQAEGSSNEAFKKALPFSTKSWA